MKSKGFTLVELLVVIAIIGLLAAIGIPAILNAQRASRNATRLKQLEAVRDAMSEFATRYNTPNLYIHPYSCTGGALTKCGSMQITDSPSLNGSQKRTEVNFTDGYELTFVPGGNDAACVNKRSKDKEVVYTYAQNTKALTYCAEGSGAQTLTYR